MLGRRAQAISPTTARNYGVIGDALVELGRYDEGFRAFDAMARMRPDLSSYARIAHARELIGDVPGATSAMKHALDDGGGTGRARGVGTRPAREALLLGRQVRRAAAAEDRRALERFPDYAYALDALARAEAARGRYRDGDRPRAAGGEPDSATAVRGDARRPLPRHRGRQRRRAGSTR